MNTPRTPRAILLDRHAAARSTLDAQRDALLTRFADAARGQPAPATMSSPSTLIALFTILHRELFAPYRRAWRALACVWLAILGFQQLEHLSAPLAAPAPSSDPSADTALLALWLEQRRELAALASETSPLPAAPRETPAPPAAPDPLGASAPIARRPAIV